MPGKLIYRLWDSHRQHSALRCPACHAKIVSAVPDGVAVTRLTLDQVS